MTERRGARYLFSLHCVAAFGVGPGLSFAITLGTSGWNEQGVGEGGRRGDQREDTDVHAPSPR